MIIKNCRIINDNVITEPADIEIQDGLITGIGHLSEVADYDAKGNYVSAGFVDIHTHGGNGSDFMDATDEAFDKILKYQLINGTTSVVATSVTSSTAQINRFINQIRNYMNGSQPYAELLGAHLEGPFLSQKNCGAQNPEYLRDPNKDDYSYILNNKDILKMVTIAPELDMYGTMTRALTENGILVAGGHDDGAFPEFMPAIHSGLKHLTHIYCAMSGFGTKSGVRETGLREYGLLDDSLSCDMIADNVHITAEMARFIIKCKGADRLALVSDALRCAGLPEDGKLYRLGNENDNSSLLVKISGGIAVLADGSKFAGSVTCIHGMIKNLIAAGTPVTDAFKMGTAVPARIIGTKNIGSVKSGYIANLCELDERFNLQAVYKHGKRVV